MGRRPGVRESPEVRDKRISGLFFLCRAAPLVTQFLSMKTPRISAASQVPSAASATEWLLPIASRPLASGDRARHN